jgi:hypothetical protein
MVGDALSRLGHQVVFNQDPNEEPGDVNIFQKRFDLPELMARLRNADKRVIWDCDDYIPDGPIEYADLVTVDTLAKLELYPGAVIIPDALDIPDDATPKTHHTEELNRVVWFGNADNLYHAANVSGACKQLGLCFVVITQLDKVPDEQREWASEWYEWDLSTIDNLLIQCNLAACSYVSDGLWSQAWVNSKSANRLLKAWGLGLPVIGTPIPSYVEVGLLHKATTVDEWCDELRIMSGHATRLADARNGMTVASTYQAKRIANKWLEVFETCIQQH